jgi:hypothetical protein
MAGAASQLKAAAWKATDELAACISVFHASQSFPQFPPAPGAQPEPTKRCAEGESLRAWLLRASPETRLRTLTVVDAPWTELTLEMAAHVAQQARLSRQQRQVTQPLCCFACEAASCLRCRSPPPPLSTRARASSS